jgi:glycine C-acetyltransferase
LGEGRHNSDMTDGTAPIEALTGSMRDFREPHGPDLLGRVEQFFRWETLRQEHDLWPYSRSTDEAVAPVCAARDENGDRFTGVNFAAQDYLSLGSHPAVREAAKAAIDQYGIHSAGTAALLGNTRNSLELEHALADFIQMDHILLYPTGWAAGFGVIKALVRPDDHIVMDALSHSCLKEGATAATRNVHLHAHLNVLAVRRYLSRIRSRDTKNAILVVTESLFSMDSDTPDIAALQDLCREFGATLLVDVAHCFGNIGEDGRGHIGLQHMLGLVDIVMGSFSKTFGSNGGFVACNRRSVREYLRFYSAPHTFSNALSPIQSAVALKSLEIVRSPEGKALRLEMMRNVQYLRLSLERAGFEVAGEPSAIVPAMMRPEPLARLVAQRLPRLGLLANMVEFPAVAKNSSRFRLQVMAKHTRDHIDQAVSRLRTAYDEAQNMLRAYPQLAAKAAVASAGD